MKNYKRLVFGIAIFLIILFPTSLKSFDYFIFSIIGGYFFGLLNTIYVNQKELDKH